MPPSCTPGDGKSVRQGTSLLYRAGEKTKASAPRGLGKNLSQCGRFFHTTEDLKLKNENLKMEVKTALSALFSDYKSLPVRQA